MNENKIAFEAKIILDGSAFKWAWNKAVSEEQMANMTFRDFFSIDEDSLLPYLRDSADGIRLPFIECRSDSEYRLNEVKPLLLLRHHRRKYKVINGGRSLKPEEPAVFDTREDALIEIARRVISLLEVTINSYFCRKRGILPVSRLPRLPAAEIDILRFAGLMQ